MKNKIRFSVRNLLTAVGCALIVGSLATVIWWHISASVYEKKCTEYSKTLSESIPPVQNLYPESRSDNTMPIFEVDKVDFVALLEFSAFDRTFPVANKWGDSEKYPCRFEGSVYDGSLVVGAADRSGQIDFVDKISVGDTVFVTDMTGGRYAYVIADIEHSDHADRRSLEKNDADFTIFVKKTMSFEYIIIRCNIQE